MSEEDKKEMKKRKTIKEEKIEDKMEIAVVEKKQKKQKKQKKPKCGESKVSDEDLVIKCRPSGLSSLVKELNQSQRLAVESIGFGGLLHMKDLCYIPWSHMHWFLQNFDPTSRVFDVEGSKKIVVTADDISDLFQLPRHEGHDVVLARDDGEARWFIKAFKARHALEGRGGAGLSMSTVHKLLKELKGGCDDFKRCFVLYSLCSFLAPTLNGLVDLRVMGSLIDVGRIVSFDWCKFVLERMCKALVGFKSKPGRKTLNGCLLVLPILYFHRMRWRGRAEPSSLPLIRHWSSKRIKERVFGDGRFGEGEWVEGVYPISNRDGENEAQEGNQEGNEVFVEVKETKRCITFKLPPNEMDDLEIHNMAKDDLDESFLLLKRDINVIYEAHTERLRKIMKKDLQQQETQAPPSSSHVIVPHI